jgi:hypothetical protein
MTYTSVTTNIARYKIEYNAVVFQLDFIGTTGGSASTQLIASLPFVGVGTSVGMGFATDGGTNKASMSAVSNGTSSVLSLLYNSANWALGANEGSIVTMKYPIA